MGLFTSSKHKMFKVKTKDCVLMEDGQARSYRSDQEIETIAKSLVYHGQLDPVRGIWYRNKFFIHIGGTRYRAAVMAKIPELMAIEEKSINERKILEQSIIENEHRHDMRAADKAKAYARLFKLNGGKYKTICESHNIKKQHLFMYLSVAKLEDEILNEANRLGISMGVLYELSRIGNKQIRNEIFYKIIKGDACNVTVRGIKKVVDNVLKKGETNVKDASSLLKIEERDSGFLMKLEFNCNNLADLKNASEFLINKLRKIEVGEKIESKSC